MEVDPDSLTTLTEHCHIWIQWQYVPRVLFKAIRLRVPEEPALLQTQVSKRHTPPQDDIEDYLMKVPLDQKAVELDLVATPAASERQSVR